MGKKLLTVISFSSFRGLLVRSFLLILFLAIGASAFSQDFKKQFNKAKTMHAMFPVLIFIIYCPSSLL